MDKIKNIVSTVFGFLIGICILLLFIKLWRWWFILIIIATILIRMAWYSYLHKRAKKMGLYDEEDPDDY